MSSSKVAQDFTKVLFLMMYFYSNFDQAEGMKHGDWTAPLDACIIGNNNIILQLRPTLEGCQLDCLRYRPGATFTCNSVEWNKNTQQCSLSEARNSNEHFEVGCSIHGWVYSEIVDDGGPDVGNGPVVGWTGGRNACIRESGNMVKDSVTSLRNCQAICIVASNHLGDFICRSVEWNSNNKQCSINDEQEGSSSFQEPCSVGGWVYSERFILHVGAQANI